MNELLTIEQRLGILEGKAKSFLTAHWPHLVTWFALAAAFIVKHL